MGSSPLSPLNALATESVKSSFKETSWSGVNVRGAQKKWLQPHPIKLTVTVDISATSANVQSLSGVTIFPHPVVAPESC
jgi:hypothetical protein